MNVPWAGTSRVDPDKPNLGDTCVTEVFTVLITSNGSVTCIINSIQLAP